MSSAACENTPVLPGASGETICLDTIKALELEILKAFDAYCNKHGLTYWIAYGTLLGAIRHKGFIPWDDDIDVVMPFDDFMRMIELTNAGERIDAPYHMGSNKILDSSIDHYAYVKVCDMRTKVKQREYRDSIVCDEGVWIDIFPLVGAPENEAQCRELGNRAYRTQVMNILCNWGFTPGDTLLGNLRRGIVYPYANLMGYRHWLRKFDRLVASYPPFGETSHCLAPPYCGVLYRSDDYAQTVYLDFEGGRYPAPAGYDAVLRVDYDDYLQFPPIEQQVSNHNFEAVWR